jgi:trigger factor
MNADVQDVAPCRKSFQVTFTADEVNNAFSETFSEFKKHAQLPGFRQGRVPAKVIERKFGKAIEDEVKGKLLQKGYVDSLKQNELSPFGQPDIKDVEELTVKRDAEVSFSGEVDVRPKFELADYKGLKLVEKITPATEKEIDERIDMIKARFAEQEEADKPAEEGDLVEGKVVLTCGEEEIFNQEERALRVEGTTLFGMEIGDVVEKLGGIKVGETREISFVIPDTYPREELRGKDAVATITPAKVLIENLPEINDEFAEKVGVENVEKLREQIKESIEADRKSAARQQLEKDLVEKLVDVHEFDIPEGLLNRQAEANLQQAKYRMMMMGASSGAMEESDENMMEDCKKDADVQIRRMLIFDAIAEKENIRINEQDFQMHLVRLSRSYGMTPDKLLKEIRERQGLESFQAEIQDIKVTEFLINEAEVTTEEVAAEENAD